jgi:small subunit ribosomal protein S6
MRPYELMYLLPPTADEERLASVSERLQGAISSLGGKVDKVTPAMRRRLAYEVDHHRDGHYGVLEFSLPPAQTRELERTIQLTEDILRHIVVRRDE